MATILIVEDNKNTQLLTSARLKPYFDIVCANDGAQAMDMVYAQPIDLIVSDIMMPNMDGYTLLKQLRSEGFQTPLILLTAKQEFNDMKEGFDLGTDDYITKPVNYAELLLRINALLRRSRISTEKKIILDSITIDSTSYSVQFEDHNMLLPKKEFELIYKLLSYPNKIFTKAQLLDDIWGIGSEASENTIKTHINRLRNRFMDCTDFEIVTIKGLGYMAKITGGTHK